MFLSNRNGFFVFILAAALGSQACGWWKNTPVALVNEPKSDAPFAAKEPTIFQADLIRSDGSVESRTFYARNDEKWRLDTFTGSERAFTLIRSDKSYSIRHNAKVYAEIPSGEPRSATPDFISDLTNGLLHQREHAQFDEIGREGNIIKYRVKIEGQTSETLIDFDTSLSLIVRHEIRSADQPASFVFELRNVKLEADDSLFEIPIGYRKVSWEELKQMPIK